MAQGNLPTPLTSFVGRNSELVQIEQRAHSARLISLVGPPGIGKTRLALCVASSLQPFFPDGVRLAALADITDSTLVVREVAAAVGIIEPSTRSIAHELGEQKLLLVLDNCEHVLESCAELATQLLTACPGLRIIASSPVARRDGRNHLSSRPIAGGCGGTSISGTRERTASGVPRKRCECSFDCARLSAAGRYSACDRAGRGVGSHAECGGERLF